jgi:hypothetical protein
MRVPSARLNAAQDAQSAPGDAPPSPGAPTCAHLFCEQSASNGDLCEQHADLMKDIRREWEDLSAEFEDGWV